MSGLLAPWFGDDRALAYLDGAVRESTADQTAIFLSARAGHHTRFAGSRIHQAQTIVETQAMVRCVVGSGSARVAVSDPAQLAGAVQAATVLAVQRNVRDGVDPAPVARPVTGAAEPGLSLWSDATAAWDERERSALAGDVMRDAARRDTTANGVLTAACTELAVATSGGVRAYGAATEAGFSLTARRGGASSYAADLGRDVAAFDVRARAQTAIDEAGRMEPLSVIPDGEHDVVFGGLATGELIGFLPAVGFAAPALLAGIGPLAPGGDREVAARSMTIADDARGGVGLPFPFDLEGTSKQLVVLVDHGRAAGAVSDLASAAATGGGSTGHAHIGREQSPAPEAANLVMEPGGETEESLIAGIDRGFYVQRLWYNRLADPKTATVIGTSRDGCFLIEHGRRTHGVAGARFTESVFCALRRADGIGDRLVSQPVPNVWNGCVSAPPVRVRRFRFGPRSNGR